MTCNVYSNPNQIKAGFLLETMGSECTDDNKSAEIKNKNLSTKNLIASKNILHYEGKIKTLPDK